jgi:glyoxylase-like metal-dependent hydrolase (beta-lactamase superfamily II)
VLFDAPPSIGNHLRRAVDEIAAANGLPNPVTHFVYSHRHGDHGGAASLFDGDVVRVGHEETRRLLLRDDDPARPVPEVTFADSYTLEVGGELVELTWHGPNHTPDNIYIHFRPRHRDVHRRRQRRLGAHLQPQPVRGRPRVHRGPGHRAVLSVVALHLRALRPARHPR